MLLACIRTNAAVQIASDVIRGGRRLCCNVKAQPLSTRATHSATKEQAASRMEPRSGRQGCPYQLWPSDSGLKFKHVFTLFSPPLGASLPDRIAISTKSPRQGRGVGLTCSMTALLSRQLGMGCPTSHRNVNSNSMIPL